jgi:hypothetical protein
MACLGNICINTLHKGAKDDNDNNNNNSNNNYNGGMERRDQVLCISFIREVPGSTVSGFLWNSSDPSCN